MRVSADQRRLLVLCALTESAAVARLAGPGGAAVPQGAAGLAGASDSAVPEGAAGLAGASDSAVPGGGSRSGASDTAVPGACWPLLARQASQDRGLDRLYAGDIDGRSAAAKETAALLRARWSRFDSAAARVEQELGLAAAAGARLVTVLDDDYPPNLRPVRDLPPFLFLLGDAGTGDIRSVAVVGTRRPTPLGLDQAARWSEALVSRGVTVVSGLAMGVDAAAHTAALRAGGRTVAVIGTGVTRTYPRQHEELSQRIAAAGAVVSPFWPSMAPARWSFPRRNAVMAGISQATLVIEASATSGAKLQARLAHEQSKGVFLIPELVEGEEWARRYLERGWATEVGDVDDVLSRLPTPQVLWDKQMTLDLF